MSATDAPVLFYGPRKAGTTVLRDLMDGGDGLVIFPHEVKLHFLLQNRDGAGRLDPGYYVGRSQTLWEANDNLDAELYGRLNRELASSAPATLDVLLARDMENLLVSLRTRPPGAPRMGMKEVGGDTRRILAGFLDLFPEGQVVLIYREPRWIVRSVLRARRRQGAKRGVHQTYAETVEAWQTLLAMREYADDARVISVQYRDLVADPQGAARQLSDFLGLPFQPIMTTPSVLGVPQKVRTASQSTTGVFDEGAPWTDDISAIDAAVVRATEAFLAGCRRWPRPERVMPETSDDMARTWAAAG